MNTEYGLTVPTGAAYATDLNAPPFPLVHPLMGRIGESGIADQPTAPITGILCEGLSPEFHLTCLQFDRMADKRFETPYRDNVAMI